MGVRTFFLGDDRVYPSNYAHVLLNPVRIDWLNSAQNYNTVVSRAVDSPGSDGHGFVTEYAGYSSVANAFQVYSPSWNAAPFRTAPAAQVVDLLNQQGLLYCDQYQYSCSFNHPLILPLLEQYLPLPTGADPSAYGCLSCDADAGSTCYGCESVQIDTSHWDGNAFADALQSRVIDPGLHAQELLQKWPYLTRLFTTISPEEMSLDPTFQARPERDYQVVSNMYATAGTLRTTCCGQQAMTVPDPVATASRQVALPGGAWPPFSSLMPWAEKVEQVPLLGDIMTVTDNAQAIDSELARWNATQNWPPTRACTSGSGASAGTIFGTGGAAWAFTPGGGAGCGCSIPRRDNALGFAGLLGLLGLGLLRGRRV
jgi:hypothetical protein